MITFEIPWNENEPVSPGTAIMIQEEVFILVRVIKVENGMATVVLDKNPDRPH